MPAGRAEAEEEAEISAVKDLNSTEF